MYFPFYHTFTSSVHLCRQKLLGVCLNNNYQSTNLLQIYRIFADNSGTPNLKRLTNHVVINPPLLKPTVTRQ